MKSTNGLGWLAAGILALGLNGFYQDGGLDWAHRAAERIEYKSAAVLALASGRADQFLAEAPQLAAHPQAVSCRWAATVAQLQSRVARGQAGVAKVEALSAEMEALSARRETQLARLEANRARIEARAARFRVAATSFETTSFNPADLHTVSFSSSRIPRCPRVRVETPTTLLDLQ